MSEKIKIGDHIKIVPGFPFNSQQFNIEGEGLPLIRIRDLLKSKIGTYYRGEYPSEYLIHEGDILIGMDGDFHIVKWKNRQKALLNQRIMKVAQKEGASIDITYFYYFLFPFLKEVWDRTTATTVKHLSTYDISEALEKFPTVNEQRKISHILSTADVVIEKTQAAIAKYKAIKQGMLHDLFTRGIDLQTGKLRPRYEDAPELYKESSLGFIPVEWEEKKLENICSMKSGEGITSIRIHEMGDYPVYGGNGLRGFTNTYTHGGEYTLIGRQGALCGNITRASGKFYASEHAVVVTVENEIDIDWLSQKLDTMNLNQYSEASAQPGLSVNKILRLSISKPSFQEQEKIAERLLSIDQKLHTEQAYLHKLLQLKAGLMGDLLSGSVKVSESRMEGI